MTQSHNDQEMAFTNTSPTAHTTFLHKFHKPTLTGRPIISGCDGPTERISSFLDHILQPIAKAKKSYTSKDLKKTTQFINFIEERKVPENAILVSMDVTSLYTNIPHEEGINTVCQAYELLRLFSISVEGSAKTSFGYNNNLVDSRSFLPGTIICWAYIRLCISLFYFFPRSLFFARSRAPPALLSLG